MEWITRETKAQARARAKQESDRIAAETLATIAAERKAKRAVRARTRRVAKKRIDRRAAISVAALQTRLRTVTALDLHTAKCAMGAKVGAARRAYDHNTNIIKTVLPATRARVTERTTLRHRRSVAR